MTYQADITDLLNRTISEMKFPIQVDSVVINADGTQTITACDIYHAQNQYTVIISSISYTITAFSYAPDTLTLQGTGTINVGDIFELYKPTFRHGTPRAIESENTKWAVSAERLPMVWLWENYKEVIADDFSPVYASYELELEVLTQADHDAWGTQQLYDYAIQPMRRLWNNVLNAIKNETQTYEATHIKHTIEPFSKFGVIERIKGVTNSIFGDKLTGISVNAGLQVWMIDACDCPVIVLTPTEGIGYGAIGTAVIN